MKPHPGLGPVVSLLFIAAVVYAFQQFDIGIRLNNQVTVPYCKDELAVEGVLSAAKSLALRLYGAEPGKSEADSDTWMQAAVWTLQDVEQTSQDIVTQERYCTATFVLTPPSGGNADLRQELPAFYAISQDKAGRLSFRLLPKRRK